MLFIYLAINVVVPVTRGASGRTVTFQTGRFAVSGEFVLRIPVHSDPLTEHIIPVPI